MLDAVQALLRNHETVWASMVKQTMVRKHPSFNENYHGDATFSKLIEDAVANDIVVATRDARRPIVLTNAQDLTFGN